MPLRDSRARAIEPAFLAWQALDSIGMFGWCGSAAVGGWLADRYGYVFTFLITAGVQATATIIQSYLVCIVPRSEAPTPDAEASSVSPLEAPTVERPAINSAERVPPAAE